jgi:glucan phosphoethanolaminetransferase (alkaline phosphatase superfamily)
MRGVRSLTPVLLWRFVLAAISIALLGCARSLKQLWKAEWGLGSAPLKASALAVFFVAVPNSLYSQSELLIANGKTGLLVIYVSITLFSLVGLTAVPFLNSWCLRVPFAMIVLAGFVTDHIVVGLYGQHVSLDLMQTLWGERDMGSTVLTAYQDTILKNFGLGALLATVFLHTPTTRWRLGFRYCILPIVAFLSVLIFTLYANGRVEIPTPAFAVPAQLAVVQMRTIPTQEGRATIDYVGMIQPPLRKIVMIVDESVRGDYLGLNNSRYDNTPFLNQVSAKIANYGTAISAVNCSDSSRAILRMGLQRQQLPDLRGTWFRLLPTIWQYAHKAGFRTALIDAWQRDRPFHSYMSDGEAKGIDIQIYPGDEPAYLRDEVVADELLELLRRDEPLFIYVNKYGIHVPYLKTYPPNMEYEPPSIVTLLQGRRNILDDYRRNVVREYHKALKWSVDDFLAKVLPAILQQPDTGLIYTSDHGQAMFDGGYDASHCSVNPDVAKGEFFVPLFVATGADSLERRFASEARRAFNRAHHLDIFPTLLEMMGYSSQWTAVHYGSSLLDVPVYRKREGLLGVFSSPAARWIDIDVDDPHSKADEMSAVTADVPAR